MILSVSYLTKTVAELVLVLQRVLRQSDDALHTMYPIFV